MAGENLLWTARNASGDAHAEVNLGRMFQHGLGVQQDMAQAITRYQKAAAQGNNTAKENLAALGRENVLDS